MPDVILLQETRCTEKNFPFTLLTDLGYHVAMTGRKQYNGVALISKYPLHTVTYHLEGATQESRYIEASILYNKKHIKIISVYIPNGGELYSDTFIYKQHFLSVLESHIKKMRAINSYIIIGGDFNIALADIDVYSSKVMHEQLCFTIQEKIMMKHILNNGLFDTFRILNETKNIFTWWNYRSNAWYKNQGLRIDYILASPSLVDLLSRSDILLDIRGMFKPSDHAPTYIALSNEINRSWLQ